MPRVQNYNFVLIYSLNDRHNDFFVEDGLYPNWIVPNVIFG